MSKCHCWKSHVMAQIISTLHSFFAIQNILTCMFSPAHHGSSCACQAGVLSGNFLRNPLQYRPHSMASRVTSSESSSCIWWKNAFHMCCTENKMSEHLRFWYSKTCLKRPLSKIQKIGFQDQLSLNACVLCYLSILPSYIIRVWNS